jgi:Mce-associated membrane protein
MKLALLGLGAALVAAGLFFGLWLNARTTTSAEIDESLANEAPEGREVATEIVELLVNIDAATLDETSERVLELSTGNFRSDYESLLPGLGPAFEEAGAKATGEIVEGPDISFTASDEAFAIAKVAQTTTVDGTERTVGFTVRLTMVMQDDEWKADRFELLGEL